MRLLPSDPDVETIVSRIKSGDINLQPDFQRGEVWSRIKKQRLIDSILRDWHVPPIHIIEQPLSKKQEVLDGQQRLAAIRDFVLDEFSVDGRIEPSDPEIIALDGKRYSDLPGNTRRQFNQFTIRLFRIVDYNGTEPAELFFRLNQPASLTGAEQRNAFFGPVREQIKQLATSLDHVFANRRFLAFSNARMAYDDVLARTSLAVGRRSLTEKITASDLELLYRDNKGLDSSVTAIIDDAIHLLGRGLSEYSAAPKFNKATLFSWLIFLVRNAMLGNHSLLSANLGEFLSSFEELRKRTLFDSGLSDRLIAGCIPAGRLVSIYDTRSSARVADVSSVILRDAAIWLAYYDYAGIRLHKVDDLVRSVNPVDGSVEDEALARKLLEVGWGCL
jgi:hypothetical protein